jgi:hypothetical protein
LDVENSDLPPFGSEGTKNRVRAMQEVLVRGRASDVRLSILVTATSLFVLAKLMTASLPVFVMPRLVTTSLTLLMLPKLTTATSVTLLMLPELTTTSPPVFVLPRMITTSLALLMLSRLVTTSLTLLTLPRLMAAATLISASFTLWRASLLSPRCLLGPNNVALCPAFAQYYSLLFQGVGDTYPLPWVLCRPPRLVPTL